MTHPSAESAVDVPAPAIDLSGEAGWTPLAIPTSFGSGRSFVSGDPDGDRLRIRYFRPASNDRLLARVWFGPGAEGPPHHAHGGSAAAVLDEVMGTACWLAGHPVVAAKLMVDFRASVPIGVVHTVEAWVEQADGRKVQATGRIAGPDGATLTDGSGLFIEIGDEKLQAIRTAGFERPGGPLFGTLGKRAV